MVKYNVIVFMGDSPEPLKYHNVSDVERLLKWIESNLVGGYCWLYANLYDSATKRYVRRVYNRKKYKYGIKS